MSRPLGISIDWNGEGRGTIVAHSEILGPQGDPSRTTLYHQVTGAVGDLLSPRRPLSSVPLLEPPEQPMFSAPSPDRVQMAALPRFGVDNTSEPWATLANLESG